MNPKLSVRTLYQITMSRGAFIVLEGVDRTGKTTQCRRLVQKLNEDNIRAEYYNFPNRSSDIGQLINSYLTFKKELSNEVIHLLFSANRWEFADNIHKKLEAGTTLVIDRYCYSGAAFSAAKGLDIDWCKSADAGLPKPDKVFFLTMPSDKIENRNGFGNERYEVPQLQKEVFKNFMKLQEDNWEILNADRSIEELHGELYARSREVIKEISEKPIKKIWMHKNGFS